LFREQSFFEKLNLASERLASGFAAGGFFFFAKICAIAVLSAKLLSDGANEIYVLLNAAAYELGNDLEFAFSAFLDEIIMDA
jgi:hypothetical protein